MEDKHKELLQAHRAKFIRCVDVDCVLPSLRSSHVFDSAEVIEISRQPTKTSQVEKLLEILPSKSTIAFQGLCLALETTYPHLLTVMFLGSNQKVQESHSVSLMSDSEDDVLRHTVNASGDQATDVTSPTTYTRIIPSSEYNLPAESLPTETLALPHKDARALSSSHDASDLYATPQDLMARYSTPPSGSGSLYSTYDPTVLYSSPHHSIELPVLRLKMDSYRKLNISPHDKHHDYDWLKTQCEKAMTELGILKRQHGESIKRCDQAMKEADYYRGKFKSALSQLEQDTTDSKSLKLHYEDLLVQKNIVEQELSNLTNLHEEDKQEITELRRQQREVIGTTGTDEALNQLCDAALEKYETIKKDYDTIRKNYAGMMGEYSGAASKLELSQEETLKYKKERDEAINDRNSMRHEWHALKLQCTTAIKNWDLAIQEIDKLKDTITKITQQRDDMLKEINQLMHGHLRSKQDVERARDERNATLHEYTLVMSERDTVHKEIEHLQDKLQEMVKSVDTLKQEKKSAQDEAETLRREVNSALQDRDRAMKEHNDICDKYGHVISEKECMLKERDEIRKDYFLATQERDVARKERFEALEHRDQILRETYEKSQKEKAEEIDIVAKEAESLKKQVEKYHQGFSEALQEAEIAKKRRDWAFSERDKIVQERESIRTLCDKLRRDRDRAVSDLAQALRDSDDIKKQKNEACRELTDVKDRYEAFLEKEARAVQLASVGHNHSRDSAIDADLHEWETEIVELDIRGMDREMVGFDVVGGNDDSQFPNDNSIFVSHVLKGGPADGKLRVNDLLLRVNNMDLMNVEKRGVYHAIFSSSTGIVQFVIRRKKMIRMYQPVQLVLPLGKDPGLQIEQGLYISRISPNSNIAKDGSLNVGDRLLTLNGHALVGLTPSDVFSLLESSGDRVVLDVWKQSSPMCSQGSSPSPIYHHNSHAHVPDHRNTPVTSPSSSKAELGQVWESSHNVDNQLTNLKNLKSSGSQTDSLDSPGLSPRKSNKTLNSSAVKDGDSKARQSHALFDKVHKMFFGEARNRSGDDHEQDNAKMSKSIEAGGGIASLEEDAIAVFDFMLKPYDNGTTSKGHSKRSRDVRHEATSHSDTWPNNRRSLVEPSDSPGTVMVHKQWYRPQLPVGFGPDYSAIPSYQRTTHTTTPTSQTAVMSMSTGPRHSPHNSESSSVRCVTTASSTNRYNPVLPHYVPSSKANITPLPHVDYHMYKRRSAIEPGTFNQYRGIPFVPNTNSDYSIKANNNNDAINEHIQRMTGRPTSVIVRVDKPLRHSTNQVVETPPSSSSSTPKMLASNDGHSSKPKTLNLQSMYPMSSSSSSTNSSTKQRAAHTSRHQQQHRNVTSPVAFSPRSGMNRPMPGTIGSPQQALSPVSYTYPNSPPSTLPRSSHPAVSDYSANFHPADRPRHAQSTGSDHRTSTHGGLPQHPSAIVSPRYSSPPDFIPAYKENASFAHDIAESDHRRFPPLENFFSTSPSPTQYSDSTLGRNTPVVTDDFAYMRYGQHYRENRPMSEYADGRSTIPKDGHNKRIRIPSNPSVTQSSIGKISGGSAEIVSGQSSPMSSILPLDLPGCSSTNSLPHVSPTREMIMVKPRKPHPGETRIINIEKTSETELIGFQIERGYQGGIFVSAVSDNSLAAYKGIVVGDQLLEFCGINFRNAAKESATRVLLSCRDTFEMLVQFNPDKFKSGDLSGSNEASPHVSHCSSPTSVHSPQRALVSMDQYSHCSVNSTSRLVPKSATDNVIYEEPRHVFLDKPSPNCELGLTIIGGNAVGIYVHKIDPDSISCKPQGIRPGDQIIEFNGVDLRNATLEQATCELKKTTTAATLVVLSNIIKYNKICTQPGDNFFVRTHFDRPFEIDGHNDGELSFKRDDILQIQDTQFEGRIGVWYVWLIDNEGNKIRGGTVPSKFKLMQDEMALRRSLSESLSLYDEDLKGSTSRRGSGSARRSFFRRRKHQRNNSKDSRELGSFSDASLSSDSVPILDDMSLFSYTRVERMESSAIRPVVVLAPLADPLIRKLTGESPDKYSYCQPVPMNSSAHVMENGLADGMFLDYWRKDDHYEYIPVSAIKDTSHKSWHCLLNVAPMAVERMHRLQIYPIVLLCRHKSPKNIRDVRDVKFLPEKLSNKMVRELFEHFSRMEHEYRHILTAIIQGGNLAEMCMQMKRVITTEQQKPIWIASGSI